MVNIGSRQFPFGHVSTDSQMAVQVQEIDQAALRVGGGGLAPLFSQESHAVGIEVGFGFTVGWGEYDTFIYCSKLCSSRPFLHFPK